MTFATAMWVTAWETCLLRGMVGHPRLHMAVEAHLVRDTTMNKVMAGSRTTAIQGRVAIAWAVLLVSCLHEHHMLHLDPETDHPELDQTIANWVCAPTLTKWYVWHD